MSKFKRSIVAFSLMALAPAVSPLPAAEPRKAPWSNARLSPDVRARLVLARMTQEEKLTLVFGYFGTDFPSKNNFRTPSEARAGSAGYIPGIPRLGIPAQWQTDAGIGVATQGTAAKKRERTALPSGLAVTAAWNPELAFKGGAMIGAEARASGFNVVLAGGVNLMREPRNGRNFEYGGEDPLLAGTMVGSMVAGIQSNKIISTIKHYAFNDQETDRDTGNSIIEPAAARMSDLLAFQLAIERGHPGAVMCSYNRVNGFHACENPWLLTQVLRKDWGWKGFVMSDWGATHSTAAAANAGLDQDSGFPFDDQPYFGAPLKEAVAKGAVTPAQIDLMAGRILRSMFAHGLFDHPITGAPMDLAPAMLARNAAVTRARRRRIVARVSGRRQCRARAGTQDLARTDHVLFRCASCRDQATGTQCRRHLRRRQGCRRGRRGRAGRRRRGRLCQSMGGRIVRRLADAR